MDAKRFEQDGKKVWTNADATVHSAAVETVVESMNLETGFIQEEKAIMWIKGNDAAKVEQRVDAVVKDINAGKLTTYRAFSTTPFYTKENGEPQEEDINPSTEVKLGRYSQVRLCIASERDAKNRAFVTLTAPVVAQPAPVVINANA